MILVCTSLCIKIAFSGSRPDICPELSCHALIASMGHSFHRNTCCAYLLCDLLIIVLFACKLHLDCQDLEFRFKYLLALCFLLIHAISEMSKMKKKSASHTLIWNCHSRVLTIKFWAQIWMHKSEFLSLNLDLNFGLHPRYRVVP